MRLETTEHDDGVVFRVRVSPGASRDRVVGVHAGALKIAVTTAPERGKANQRVLQLLAEQLDLPAARLTILSGETGRDKRVLLRGSDGEELLARLDPCG